MKKPPTATETATEKKWTLSPHEPNRAYSFANEKLVHLIEVYPVGAASEALAARICELLNKETPDAK